MESLRQRRAQPLERALLSTTHDDTRSCAYATIGVFWLVAIGLFVAAMAQMHPIYNALVTTCCLDVADAWCSQYRDVVAVVFTRMGGIEPLGWTAVGLVVVAFVLYVVALSRRRVAVAYFLVAIVGATLFAIAAMQFIGILSSMHRYTEFASTCVDADGEIVFFLPSSGRMDAISRVKYVFLWPTLVLFVLIFALHAIGAADR